MALGPTGVGKTAAAEWLQHALRALGRSDDRYGYLRLDMSEYQEPHRLSQLLGAPQGYLGYGDGAQLVDALIANPRTTVLFDEIEKAHHNILRALMNAMDAGRLSAASAGNGRQIDCRRAIFMFTSNLEASVVIREAVEQDAFGNRSLLDSICRRRLQATGMAPELIGRIGRFLLFRSLSPEARAEVVTLSITRVAQEYGLRIVRIDASVVADVLNACPADGFGARPTEYLVDDLLGACFGETVERGPNGPLVLNGQPYRCAPAISPQTSVVSPCEWEATG